LKFGLSVTHQLNLCTISTLLKSTDAELVTVLVCLHSVLHSEIQEKLYRIKWCILVIQGQSGSSKLVSVESPYAISFQYSI